MADLAILELPIIALIRTNKGIIVGCPIACTIWLTLLGQIIAVHRIATCDTSVVISIAIVVIRAFQDARHC